MFHTLDIKAGFILDLIKLRPNDKEYILKHTSFYDTQRRMSDTEVSEQDKELYQLLVENRGIKLNDVYLLKYLDERMGLIVLRNIEIWDIERINEYVPYQSHIDYINSLNKENRVTLKHTFWKEYVNIEFISKIERKTRDILMLNEYPYISFGDSYKASESVFKKYSIMGEYYTGTTHGYIFRNMEDAERIVNKIADIEHKINVKKEEVAFNCGTMGKDYKYFNVPTIVAVLSEEQTEFEVKAVWDNDACTFTSSFVEDVEMAGNIDDIIFCEAKSLYLSNHNGTDKRINAAKDMNVPLNGKNVPAEYYDEIVKKVAEETKIEHAEIRERVNKVLEEKGMSGEIKIENGEVTVSINFKYDDGFEYTASSKGKYFTSEADTVKWIKNFNKLEMELSYNFERLYSIFLAKDLPAV